MTVCVCVCVSVCVCVCVILLLQICEALPKTQQGILACCNPVPALVRQHLMDLTRLVSQARQYIATPIDNNQVSCL